MKRRDDADFLHSDRGRSDSSSARRYSSAMQNPRQAFDSSEEDLTEAALLSAVHAARSVFETASPDDKTHSREAFIAALKAFNAYICGESYIQS